jgi:hypothetical protein
MKLIAAFRNFPNAPKMGLKEKGTEPSGSIKFGEFD